ncbi:MAG TPA: hypothetical protein VNQ32_02070 [Steroidobacteraceae bacterium]|nr:hypothetical protein [Steroidobacteraceae bacterium]
MRIAVLAAVLLWVPQAGAADALQISRIEQDLRRLEIQLQDQARQIESLRLQLAARANLPAARLPAAAPAPPAQMPWLDASKWAQIHPGMPELEVLTLLGPPTSMRNAEGGRVLHYAHEIGASGFLAGSVRLRDGVVAEVEIPRLR